nr:hypothetical protein [Tanacetum cinerariifolium]
MNRDHTEELLKDLDEARKKKKKSRDSLNTPPGSPPHQPPPPPPPAGPSRTSGSSKASGSSQVPPTPPPPPSTNQEGQSHGSTTPSSSKTTASAEYKAWKMTDTRLRLSVSSTSEDLQMDDDMAPDTQAYSFDDDDIENAHIPKASALTSTYSPPPEDSLLARTGDMAMLMDWFHKRQGITKLKPQDLEGPTFELVKVFHPNLNLTKPRWDATCFKYKHDYTVIDSIRAITFWDRYGVHMIMRFNEIHKFSDGTLRQIDETLDYRVKEFKVNMMNPGLNTRFWTRKDVDRSKEFMFVTQKQLKTRRIFRNLESFVGGRKKFKDHDSNVDFPPFANSSGLGALDCDSMETLVSLDEVKSAVWDCGNSKAPGLDGFAFAFVNKY